MTVLISFPIVKPKHTTQDILEDAHYGSENYGILGPFLLHSQASFMCSEAVFTAQLWK